MLKFDYYAYNNRLNKVSMVEKIALGLGGLVLVLFFDNTRTGIAVVITMYIMLWYARIPMSFIAKFWLATGPFMLVSILTIALNIGASCEPEAELSIRVANLYISVVQSNMQMALAMLQRSFAAVTCLLFIALTTPIAHIVAFLSRYQRLRTIMEIMLLTYRFIFVILLCAEETYVAQQSRLGYCGFRRQIKSVGLLAAAVARKSFINMQDINQALAAVRPENAKYIIGGNPIW